MKLSRSGLILPPCRRSNCKTHSLVYLQQPGSAKVPDRNVYVFNAHRRRCSRPAAGVQKRGRAGVVALLLSREPPDGLRADAKARRFCALPSPPLPGNDDWRDRQVSSPPIASTRLVREEMLQTPSPGAELEKAVLIDPRVKSGSRRHRSTPAAFEPLAKEPGHGVGPAQELRVEMDPGRRRCFRNDCAVADASGAKVDLPSKGTFGEADGVTTTIAGRASDIESPRSRGRW